MPQPTLTQEQKRQLLLDADRFYWETFAHKPLNVFDLGQWLLSFPGEITQARDSQPWRYANYKIDINDLDTCPKYSDSNNIRELWNNDSQEIMWLLGRDSWGCHVHADGFALITGACRVGITVSRFQNIEGVSDLHNSEQLTTAIYSQLAQYGKRHGYRPILSSDCFTKKTAGHEWSVVRSRSNLNEPDYIAATALDYRTAVTASFAVGSAWYEGEDIPPEIEEKYLASFWDFLAQINLAAMPAEGATPGTIERTAPGAATKAKPETSGW
ncbi:MAG TPA: hypothetical protein VIC26_02795 [Marinagarivorans sp.]